MSFFEKIKKVVSTKSQLLKLKTLLSVFFLLSSLGFSKIAFATIYGNPGVKAKPTHSQVQICGEVLLPESHKIDDSIRLSVKADGRLDEVDVLILVKPASEYFQKEISSLAEKESVCLTGDLTIESSETAVTITLENAKSQPDMRPSKKSGISVGNK